MAFKVHPWVAKAAVTKRAGPRVNVDIVYRRPVCMVEVANAGTLYSGSTVDLLPVDGEGVWLPGEDFSQKQKETYPCLAGIDHRPIQPVGHPWGDARVVDGASIAAALLPVWQQLKLYRIQTAARTSAADDRGPTYELYTRTGTRIDWGLAIGRRCLGRAHRGRQGCPSRTVCGGSRKSRRRTIAGCPQDSAAGSREAIGPEPTQDSWRRAKRWRPRELPAICRRR